MYLTSEEKIAFLQDIIRLAGKQAVSVSEYTQVIEASHLLDVIERAVFSGIQLSYNEQETLIQKFHHAMRTVPSLVRVARMYGFTVKEGHDGCI